MTPPTSPPVPGSLGASATRRGALRRVLPATAVALAVTGLTGSMALATDARPAASAAAPVAAVKPADVTAALAAPAVATAVTRPVMSTATPAKAPAASALKASAAPAVNASAATATPVAASAHRAAQPAASTPATPAWLVRLQQAEAASNAAKPATAKPVASKPAAAKPAAAKPAATPATKPATTPASKPAAPAPAAPAPSTPVVSDPSVAKPVGLSGEKVVPRTALPRTAIGSTAATTAAPAAAGPTAVPLRVVRVSTTDAFQAALAAARAGDRILLDSGTYRGPFELKASGTAANPIVVAASPGADVTLMTPDLKYPSCNATGPDEFRTISFVGGASHWVLAGLTVNGGLKISSKNADATQDWQKDKILTGNWQARRAVPGASERNPIRARDAVAYLQGVVHETLYPSDDIQIIGNTFVGKGIFGRLTRYGVLSNNTITNVACGTGPGVWMTNFSSGWVVSGNDVSKVAHSTAIHYMQEGIRFGNGSDYNVIAGNNVHDLTENSRAITTDQDASWNLITGNTVSNADIAFNEQMSSWGNVWTLNRADNIHKAAYSFRMEDIGLSTPSKSTSSYFTQVSCNTATNSEVAFQVGAVSGGRFSANSFATTKVGKELQGYWAQQDNRWDGAASAPDRNPSQPLVLC